MALATDTVRIATLDDLDLVADILGDAFTADPTISWLVADPARRRPMLTGFFRAGLETLWLRHRFVPMTDDGAAAAMWLPPDGLEATDEELAQVMPAWEAAIGPEFAAFMGFMAAMEEGHPHEPHYYLMAIGTRPGLQSRGLGSKLLRAALDRCDAEGMPAYLEATTTRSQALYERHGFVTFAPLVLPGGPTLYRMWRESR
jgi:ribosomal protein S18 acetylase RimI-like enzyme